MGTTYLLINKTKKTKIELGKFIRDTQTFQMSYQNLSEFLISAAKPYVDETDELCIIPFNADTEEDDYKTIGSWDKED